MNFSSSYVQHLSMSITRYYDTRLIIEASSSYLPHIPSSRERGRLFSRRTSFSSFFSSPLTLADRPPSPWSVDASSLPSVRRRARAADRDHDASEMNRFADPIWKTESNGVVRTKTNRGSTPRDSRAAQRRKSIGGIRADEQAPYEKPTSRCNSEKCHNDRMMKIRVKIKD